MPEPEPLDDVIARVARDVFGANVAFALRAAMGAERAGASAQEAERVALDVLARQRAADEARDARGRG